MRRRLRKLFMSLVLALLVAAWTMVAHAEDEAPVSLVLVANEQVPSSVLSQRQIQRIFLGKAKRWDGGLSIKPVMLHVPPVQEQFINEILERSEESFSVYWKRMVYTGKGQPPPSFDTSEDLADYLRTTPGAIGYLPLDADHSGLKIVTLD